MNKMPKILTKDKDKDKNKYFEAVGRRKSAVARVRLIKKKGAVLVNGKELSDFFHTLELKEKAISPLKKARMEKDFSASVKVCGGGVTGQAEAIRLGVARALLKFDSSLRSVLKLEGFLKRDPRAKERRKFGLKKARKAPQWSKR